MWQQFPLWIVILIAVSFSGYLWKTRRKVSHTHILPEKEQRNIDVMASLVKAHSDFTAEVIPFSVFGRKNVETSRLKEIGEDLDVRQCGDIFRVYAFAEPIAELIVPKTSLIPSLLRNNDKIKFYLGGRDASMIYNDKLDLCSLIAFYKKEGVPPTKVNLV